jgi:hypothetical protein
MQGHFQHILHAYFVTIMDRKKKFVFYRGHRTVTILVFTDDLNMIRNRNGIREFNEWIGFRKAQKVGIISVEIRMLATQVICIRSMKFTHPIGMYRKRQIHVQAWLNKRNIQKSPGNWFPENLAPPEKFSVVFLEGSQRRLTERTKAQRTQRKRQKIQNTKKLIPLYSTTIESINQPSSCLHISVKAVFQNINLHNSCINNNLYNLYQKSGVFSFPENSDSYTKRIKQGSK